MDPAATLHAPREPTFLFRASEKLWEGKIIFPVFIVSALVITGLTITALFLGTPFLIAAGLFSFTIGVILLISNSILTAENKPKTA